AIRRRPRPSTKSATWCRRGRLRRSRWPRAPNQRDDAGDAWSLPLYSSRRRPVSITGHPGKSSASSSELVGGADEELVEVLVETVEADLGAHNAGRDRHVREGR